MLENINIFNNLGKLFCTFTAADHLEETINTINRKYSVLYNKVFVLEIANSEELVCTYNIDTGNISNNPISNTILMHRKKESNTLYTINALNYLIMSLNNGKADNKFIVNWKDYQNSILLTNKEGFRKLDTKIHTIIDFSLN